MSFFRLAFTFAAGAGSAFAAQNWLTRASSDAPAASKPKPDEKPFLSTIPFKPKAKKDEHKEDDDCPVCTDRTEDFLKQIESIGKTQAKVAFGWWCHVDFRCHLTPCFVLLFE
jgi:hypothetical protein